MTMKPKRENNQQGDYLAKASQQEMEARLKKKMKKKKQPYEDPRFPGMTINAVRQQQRRQNVVSSIVSRANEKKRFGLPLLPEEQWVMSNGDILM